MEDKQKVRGVKNREIRLFASKILNLQEWADSDRAKINLRILFNLLSMKFLLPI